MLSLRDRSQRRLKTVELIVERGEPTPRRQDCRRTTADPSRSCGRIHVSALHHERMANVKSRKLSKDTATSDVSRRPVDLSPVKALISLIVERCKPVSVWLFGSRARGEERDDSDWDLLVVLPDSVSEEELYDSLSPWHLRRLTRVNADVVYCNDSDFAEAISVPNTLAYEVARNGLAIA